MTNLLALTSMGRKRLTLSNASPSAQLAIPVANTPTTATTGGSFGAFAQVYFRISAMDAFGETFASNEVTVATGAGTTNTCTVTWAAVTGATGYKVYRIVGFQLNEKLVATVGAVTTYTDTGSITPSGAVPTLNDTGLVTVATVPAGTSWRKFLITATNRDGSRNQLFVRVAGAEWVAYNADILGYDSTDVAFDHAMEAGETVEAAVTSARVRLTMSVEELA